MAFSGRVVFFVCVYVAFASESGDQGDHDGNVMLQLDSLLQRGGRLTEELERGDNERNEGGVMMVEEEDACDKKMRAGMATTDGVAEKQWIDSRTRSQRTPMKRTSTHKSKALVVGLSLAGVLTVVVFFFLAGFLSRTCDDIAGRHDDDRSAELFAPTDAPLAQIRTASSERVPSLSASEVSSAGLVIESSASIVPTGTAGATFKNFVSLFSTSAAKWMAVTIIVSATAGLLESSLTWEVSIFGALAVVMLTRPTVSTK